MGMSAKCKCSCIYLNCCKKCSYKNPQNMPPLEYEYWNTTWWMNFNTTDGWGGFPSSESGQNNNTYDNLSGYGVSDGSRDYNRTLPSGKKLVRVYKYNNRIFSKPNDLIFYNNNWVPISNIPGVERIFRIITV